MTAQARITQADIDRAVKSVRAAGYEQARIEMDLVKQRIVIIIGAPPANDDPGEEWGDDDV